VAAGMVGLPDLTPLDEDPASPDDHA